MSDYGPGYYWARHKDTGFFVVLRQNEHWYCPGVGDPIDDTFEDRQVLGAVWPSWITDKDRPRSLQ